MIVLFWILLILLGKCTGEKKSKPENKTLLTGHVTNFNYKMLQWRREMSNGDADDERRRTINNVSFIWNNFVRPQLFHG